MGFVFSPVFFPFFSQNGHKMIFLGGWGNSKFSQNMDDFSKCRGRQSDIIQMADIETQYTYKYGSFKQDSRINYIT